ncbi:MAG TPA: Txe/YoeB family addiction module toxin [Verrucomicrobiae bacterium]|nr:Txe/YoeB family addiction module toxin [Verrucomicrobiae bacterium]
MNLIFSDQAWEDYQFWLETDKKMLRRIHELLKDIRRNPHSGIGKPEPLRHALAGYWSRRIDQEHRMVYKVTEHGIHLVQMRYHY